MTYCIRTPAHAGARDQVHELAGALPSDLSDQDIALDCRDLLVGTPSFMDEIVNELLIVRGARSLSVQMAPPRAQQLLERSAENRGLRSQLKFAVPS